MPVAAPTVRNNTAQPSRGELPPFEVSGAPSAPVVVVLGGISATQHVCANAIDRTPGWWDVIAGQGKAIDTDRYRIVSYQWLDGGRDERGRPVRAVTTHDQADALAAVLDHIGAERVHAIVGASYGGFVALAFAERYPKRAQRVVVIGAAHKPHPMSTARRAIQRRIVELALDAGRGKEGLALARALAITTYRSPAEFADRFASAPTVRASATATFPVEKYLDHNAERFAAAWEPSRFLALSLSGDLHSVNPASITVPTTVIAIEDDEVVPLAQMRELAEQLAGPVRLRVLPTRNGHDAFLARPDALGPELIAALEAPVRK
ncbi:MAG TPA: homoserine O-succinyltransferase [Gemmatimonadaceae bacterium]|nr:homoserine O-succinyltransferase [Gemmatimonadaceae bacterium]